VRRIFGIFFNTLAVLSLLLCVATVFLWVRSYTTSDRVIWIEDQDNSFKVFRAVTDAAA